MLCFPVPHLRFQLRRRKNSAAAHCPDIRVAMDTSPNSFFLLLFLLVLPSVAVAVRGGFTEAEETAIANLQSYLRICTAHPSPDYSSASSFLLSIATSLPFLHTTTLHFAAGKPLLLFSWTGSDASLPSVLLNSHLDSVPAEPLKWLYPPFAAVRDAATGRIYARGAQDDKSIAIQYLEAIRNLHSSGFRPLRSLHLSFVPDEEIGGADGAAQFAASEHFRSLNVGMVLDEGQASPTDEFRVFYADRLPWNLIVKASGPPGHGSRMYDGSAVENLMDCAAAAAMFREEQFGKVKAGERLPAEVISVNPVYMKAGTPTTDGFVMNVQPSETEMGFDIRLPPTEDPELLSKRIAEEWAPAIKNMTFKLMEKGPIKDRAGRPLVTATNASNPWWVVFEQAIISSGGKLRKPEMLSSTTDARFMRQMGIPTIGFSPMANTPILLHDHNEFLEDRVFLRGIHVYEHVISFLTSFSGSPA